MEFCGREEAFEDKELPVLSQAHPWCSEQKTQTNKVRLIWGQSELTEGHHPKL